MRLYADSHPGEIRLELLFEEVHVFLLTFRCCRDGNVLPAFQVDVVSSVPLCFFPQFVCFLLAFVTGMKLMSSEDDYEMTDGNSVLAVVYVSGGVKAVTFVSVVVVVVLPPTPVDDPQKRCYGHPWKGWS